MYRVRRLVAHDLTRDDLCHICFGGFVAWCRWRGFWCRKWVRYDAVEVETVALERDDVRVAFDDWLEKGRPCTDDKKWRDAVRKTRAPRRAERRAHDSTDSARNPTEAGGNPTEV